MTGLFFRLLGFAVVVAVVVVGVGRALRVALVRVLQTGDLLLLTRLGGLAGLAAARKRAKHLVEELGREEV